jgi:hypothetical protein
VDQPELRQGSGDAGTSSITRNRNFVSAPGRNRTCDSRFRKPREHVDRCRLRNVPAGSGAGCISVDGQRRTLLATSWPQLSRGTRAARATIRSTGAPAGSGRRVSGYWYGPRQGRGGAYAPRLQISPDRPTLTKRRLPEQAPESSRSAFRTALARACRAVPHPALGCPGGRDQDQGRRTPLPPSTSSIGTGRRGSPDT